MARKRAGLAVVAALALAVAAGCLEFDEQTVYFEYDRHRDTLLMIVNYSGLYAAAENGRPDIEDSQNQLEEAIQVKRAAFFGNWPWLWSSEDVRKEWSDAEQHTDMPHGVREKMVRLTELVTVLNGGFYSDAAGRICGAQVVVIEHASEAINLINDAANGALLADQANDPAKRHTEFEELAGQYARRGHRWVDLDGNSLIVRIPATEKMVKEKWAEVLEDVSNTAEMRQPDFYVQLAQVLQVLSTPAFLWYEDGVLKGRLGLPSYASLLHTRPAQGKCQPNMVDYITQKHGLDLDARIARFLLAPDALPDTEADKAAKFMAPRLTKAERVRVLVHQLRAAPSEPLWAMLRQEPLPGDTKAAPTAMTDDARLKLWESWLKKQAPAPVPPTPPTEEKKAG